MTSTATTPAASRRPERYGPHPPAQRQPASPSPAATLSSPCRIPVSTLTPMPARPLINAATVVVRRAVTHGWGFDFNYTFSHALDNGSASETSGGAALQDAFNPNAFRGPSDFDARHTISADAVVEIPVGKGKALLGHIPGWLDYMIGGWQASSLYTFRTGLPLNCTDSRRLQCQLRLLGVLHREARLQPACQRLHLRSTRASPASSPTPTR